MSRTRNVMIGIAIVLASALANAQQPAAAKSEPALDINAMDRGTDPCVDFFAYSCGGWIKKNPIPADQSSWDTYSKMQDENLSQLRGILDEASAPDTKRNAVTQKIGDYYASCTDEKTIDATVNSRSCAETNWATWSGPASSNSTASWPRSANRWTAANGT